MRVTKATFSVPMHTATYSLLTHPLGLLSIQVVMLALGIAECIMEGLGGVYAVQ